MSNPTRIDRYGREVRLDRNGLEYVRDDDGFAFYITPCCDASAKGSIALGEPATVCRSCYEEIDPLIGCVPEPLDEDMTDEQRQRLQEWNEWERRIVARSLGHSEEDKS